MFNPSIYEWKRQSSLSWLTLVTNLNTYVVLWGLGSRSEREKVLCVQKARVQYQGYKIVVDNCWEIKTFTWNPTACHSEYICLITKDQWSDSLIQLHMLWLDSPLHLAAKISLFLMLHPSSWTNEQVIFTLDAPQVYKRLPRFLPNCFLPYHNFIS